MKVLFVCTGNICRSPMGELMFPLFFHDASIVTDSAGTQGLIDQPIDPSSATLMERDGIEYRQFRSKRLTPQLANSSDLILCFTGHQKRKIAALAPRAARRTFTVVEFANLCAYCRDQGLVSGTTVQERLDSILDQASLVSPYVDSGEDIRDPYRKEFPVFVQAHDELGAAIATMASALELPRGQHVTAR